MHDVGPFAPQHPGQLHQPGQIPPGIDRAAHVSKRNEMGPRGCRSLAEGAHTMCCDGDVEAAGERGQERSDVALRAAHLRQRDHEQHPRLARVRS